VQNSVIKAMQVYSSSTDRVLLQKYMNAMKFNLKLQKIRREQLEYSAKFYFSKLKRKYIRKMTEAYNKTIEAHQNEYKACQHFNERIVIYSWRAF